MSLPTGGKPGEAALLRRHGHVGLRQAPDGTGCFAWPRTNEPGALRVVAEELTLLLTESTLKPKRARGGEKSGVNQNEKSLKKKKPC